MRFEIEVLPGDGIGPEVAAEGVKVLEAVGKRSATSSFSTTTMWGVLP